MDTWTHRASENRMLSANRPFAFMMTGRFRE